ncbi:hypothetical protein [Niveispirillum sp. KHB5.9]|uniref:hypothetical protein n=1 Tax=Niveispirillum sp. KHB5.9 TaxID=3400269 RepID=UPI003A84771E
MLTGAILLVLLAVLTYLVLEHGRYWQPPNLWLCRLTAYPALAVGLILAVFLTFTGQALADETVTATADLRPLWGYGVELVFVILSVLGGWLFRRLFAHLGLKDDDRVRGYLDQAFARALQYGLGLAVAKGADLAEVHVRNQMVADAATYVSQTVPGALKRFGIDAAGLEMRLLARLPEVAARVDQGGKDAG